MGPCLALLGHPAVAAVVGRRRLPPRPLLLKLLEWAPPFVMAELEVRSPHASARCLYVTCPFLPEQLATQPFTCLAKVRQGVELAAGRGARLVGLGGFTSIAARRVRRTLGVPCTSGSRLTAALAVAQTLEAARLAGLEPAGATAAVIGGLGEVGRRCAELLAGRVGRLILTTRRPRNRAMRSGPPPGEMCADNRAAAAQADLIIAAAAAPGPVLEAACLRPGAVVCDVGYPPNVAGPVGRGHHLPGWVGQTTRSARLRLRAGPACPGTHLRLLRRGDGAGPGG